MAYNEMVWTGLHSIKRYKETSMEERKKKSLPKNDENEEKKKRRKEETQLAKD